MLYLCLLLFLQTRKFAQQEYLLIAGIIILIILIIHSVLYYLNFYFYIENGEFILKKGYLQKKQLSIPLDRIQNINSKQNVLQQILKVSAIEIDTAGTVSKELKIHALDASSANVLSDIIVQHKKSDELDESEENEIQIQEELILKLDNSELLKVGISRNHLRAAFLLLVFGNQIYTEVKDIFTSQTEEYSRQATEYMDNAGWIMISALVVIFIIISISYSMIETLLRFYGLHLRKTGDSFKMISGLLNRKNVLIPFKKVQILTWQTSPLMKLFKIYQVKISQATSAEIKTKNIVSIPGCYDRHVEMVRDQVFEDEIGMIEEKSFSDIYLFRRYWIRNGWIPAILPAPFLYDHWLYWGAMALWILITGFLSFKSYSKRYFQLSENQIRIGKGLFGTEWNQMELYKIQAVRYSQNIFQKRRNLATLIIHSAAGDLRIPYIPISLATSIYNYLLFRIESSDRAWM